MSRGWIGTVTQMLAMLEHLDADREDGAFVVGPREAFCVGLGGVEIVLTGDAKYRKHGTWHPLCPHLHQSNFGVAIAVV